MNQQFEDYVNEATKALPSLTKQERANEAEEIRQHLEALAHKHEVCGLTEEAAVLAAVAEFGPPRLIRAGLRKIYLKRMVKTLGSALFSLIGMAIAGFISLIVASILVSLFHPVTDVLETACRSVFPSSVTATYGFRVALLFGPTMLAAFTALIGGLLAGWFFPRRAWSGVWLIYILFFANRLYPEFVKMYTYDLTNPRMFWLPFLFTLFYSITLLLGQLIGVHYASRKRLASLNRS